MQPVIRFENVGKLYRLGTVGTGTLSHDLRRWWITSVMRKEDPYLKIGETNDRSTKGNSDYVYALKDINLEVQEGDVLGIIGKNGAGKSTLLKLLSRVTAPTTGKIYTKGRIASLLEVGTGFHPELTGRENIYMNGCILGMKRWEIDKKLDEIVDFSGCERYIDTPVKRYSSGMMVRLGFAVAAHLDPEILVVDEVLAVGDAEFQKKAIGKMQDVSKGQGRTVLFVSHNMAAVRQLCMTGIILQNGQLFKKDNINEIVSEYLRSDVYVDLCGNWKRNNTSSKSDFILSEVKIKKNDDNISTNFSCDDDINIELTVNCIKKIPGLYGCLYLIKEPDNTFVLQSDSNDNPNYPLETIKLGPSTITIQIPKRSIAPGKYSIRVDFSSIYNFSGFNIERTGKICAIEVLDSKTQRGDRRIGYFSTIIRWKFE